MPLLLTSQCMYIVLRIIIHGSLGPYPVLCWIPFEKILLTNCRKDKKLKELYGDFWVTKIWPAASLTNATNINMV